MVFIVFEGGEGSGKSTQVQLLADAIRATGRETVTTREPGGSQRAELIRELILAPDSEGITDRCEALLFAAARADHIASVIRPAIRRGAVVLCDRYLDSSVAYQGVARGLGADRIRSLNGWATDGLLPDITIVLDIDPAVGLQRAQDANRLEAEPEPFHRAVRQAFLDFAAADPQRYAVIDAVRSPDRVAAAVFEAVQAILATS